MRDRTPFLFSVVRIFDTCETVLRFTSPASSRWYTWGKRAMQRAVRIRRFAAHSAYPSARVQYANMEANPCLRCNSRRSISFK